MKAKAWRLYGAADARLEDIELEGAGGAGAVTSTGGGYDDIFLFAAVPALITHVGGLDSAFGATLDLLKAPGGKRLVYTHVKMPMTAISDFAKLGETDPFYAELDRLCTANKGLWCKAAEDYLLAHAPKLEIGEPKELVKERVIRIG